MELDVDARRRRRIFLPQISFFFFPSFAQPVGSIIDAEIPRNARVTAYDPAIAFSVHRRAASIRFLQNFHSRIIARVYKGR